MYSSLEDIKKQIGEGGLIQLTDDENLGVVNQARVDEAIARADAEIEAYTGARFVVPFLTVPDIVKKFSIDIAVYNLYSRRDADMPDVRLERYKSAVRQLEGIAKGVISIGGDLKPGDSRSGVYTTNKTESDRMFTRDFLGKF